MKKWIVGSTIAAAAAIASVLFFSTYSLGTTRYVKSGLSCSNYRPATNDCGTGGTATVYSSIANAFNAGTTVAGDTLYIRAGTYAEQINSNSLTIPTGTTWANAPVISAYPSETVVLQPSSGSEVINLPHAYIKYVIFDGLVLDAVNNVQDAISLNGNHLRFQNMEIKNARLNGILGGGDSHEFINLRIHDNGIAAGTGYGFYMGASTNILIERCEFYNLPRYAIHIYDGNFPSLAITGTIIRKNKFHDTGLNLAQYSAAILLSSGSGNVVYNNLIYNNLRGMQVSNNASNNKIYNNTFYGNTNEGIEIYAGQPGTIVKNNIFYSNGGSISNSGSGTQMANNFCQTMTTGCTSSGNPAFVSTSDFHLTAGSPAIGKGCTTCGTELTSIFTTDYDDNDRQASIPWDAGAYEYQSGGGASMTLGSPDGLTPWTIGSQQTITWTCVGCNGTGFIIDLDRGNDGTFEESIIASTPGPNSYVWPSVTGTANANCKIRVRDSDGTPVGTSAVFAISASSGGTITKRITDNNGTGYISGVDDAYMFSLAPTANTGTEGIFYVSKDTATNQHNNSLLRFSGLSQITSAATVTSVTLGLYLEEVGSGATGQPLQLRRLLRTWGEGTATWNNYNATTAWQTAGALGALDRDSTVLATMTGIGQTPGYYTVTDTGLLKTFVQNIISGSTANEGLHLEDSTTGDAIGGFTSSDGTIGQRPYLDVTYTVGTATITMTEPKAGDLFLSGQQGPVRWTSQGLSGTVNIDLSRDGGTTWENLTSAAYNASDVTVTYNAPTSSNCKVRVVSVSDTSINSSSGTFRIGGTRAGFTLVP